MTKGNEYTGKRKLGIIAALCVVFSIWLAIGSKIVLTALIMIALAIFLFAGNKIARWIFIVLQFTRGISAIEFIVTNIVLKDFAPAENLYYALYLIYAVVSIIMLLADKDIKEFYR